MLSCRKLMVRLIYREKLQLIIKYCKDFHADDSKFKVSGDLTLNNLEIVLENKLGSCQHRSAIFLMLCHYYQIPARVLESETHVFVEVKVDNELMQLT